MKQTIFILFFLLTFSFAFSQKVAVLEFKEIDKLIIQKNFAKAKSKLAKLDKNKDLSIINLHKIYEYKIRVAQLEKQKEQEIKLMENYVMDTILDSVFIKNRRYSRFNSRVDTFRIYSNKSSFSRRLAIIHQAKKDYNRALKFLTLHETKYLFPHPCGTGRRTDELERKIISGEIHQKLGNHKIVFKKLLPLTFGYTFRDIGKSDESKIDSILMISLNLLYSKNEISSEFLRCIKTIPEDKTNSAIRYETKIEMFETDFIIHSVKRLQYSKERKREVYKIRDSEKREKIKKEIYKEAFKTVFETNRIFKLVSK